MRRNSPFQGGGNWGQCLKWPIDGMLVQFPPQGTQIKEPAPIGPRVAPRRLDRRGEKAIPVVAHGVGCCRRVISRPVAVSKSVRMEAERLAASKAPPGVSASWTAEEDRTGRGRALAERIRAERTSQPVRTSKSPVKIRGPSG